MLEDHQKRIKEACEEITEIVTSSFTQYYPKPRSKNKYCGVCRGHY
jgi:hypothetical protein